jgi:sugar/nucleoside kinase (ribokinase family)
MTPGFDALVAGHICLDIHPDLSGSHREPFDKIFLPGRLIAAGPVSYSSGGAVSNTGLALNRLGIVTRLRGKVGNDLFGQALEKIIAGHGSHLTKDLIVDPSAGTSYTIIIDYPGADRIFLHFPGANDFFLTSDIPNELLAQARLFHFGYPQVMRSTFIENGKILTEIFRQAKRTGITTSLDLAFPDPSSEAGQADWRRILESVLPMVDIFLPSAEEILFMLRRNTYEEMRQTGKSSDILPLLTAEMLSDLGQELITMGAKIVGLKLGYRGMYLRTAESSHLELLGKACPSNLDAWAGKELWAPCFKVAVAGTTGSGDATIAGFLAAILRGLSVEQSLTMAVAVGACNVEATDSLSGIRDWEDTVQRIYNGWEHQPLELNTPGWDLDQASGLWHGPCL